MAPTNMQYALKYLRMGFSVIPCRRDKKSLIKWEPYQLQKPTQDEIRKWWTEHPDANIAIVCGAVSGIDVLDCDSQEAYDNVNEFYLSDTFQTPTSKTPKGRHLYFKHRSGLTNKVRAIKGTDIRTHGGYVLAPPSKNGSDTPYYWFDGLKPDQIPFAEWPDELFATLQAVAAVQRAPKAPTPDVAPDDDPHELFTEGRRDNDLFHVANLLTKGGAEESVKRHVLGVLARACRPPFPPEEIDAKIKSALQRRASRERNLTNEVKDWVIGTSGDFTIDQCRRDLDIKGKEENTSLRQILVRLSNENVIERGGKKNGTYRLVEDQCKVMDWINVDCEYKHLWLPLDLGQICGVQPGNILVFAGAKDSGKTAFLMNIAKENRYDYKVHYFNSEMGPAEFKMRAFLFGEPLSTWKDIRVYERAENFHDVIQPGEGNLNIIDFLEVHDEFWKIGTLLQKIHQKLNGSLCVVGLQKNPGVDFGRGGAFSIEKARLYISLDYGKAKITSCKNFKPNDLISGNPRGYTCTYKLINGCDIRKQPPGWASEIKLPKSE